MNSILMSIKPKRVVKIAIGEMSHISDLKIYDKPKALSEFAIPCNKSNEKCITCKSFMGAAGLPFCKDLLTRPPQSWFYIQEVQE